MVQPRLTPFLRWRAPPLGVQLLLGLSLIAVVVAFSAGVIVRNSERAYLGSLLSTESQRKFRLLVFASLDDVISEDIPRLQTTMEEVERRDTALASVRITNEDGRILYEWRRGGSISQPDLLSFTRDVRLAGEHFGTFSANWDISELRHEVDSHAHKVAAELGAVCLVLGLLVFLLVHGLAVVPINRIAQRLAEFHRGVLDRVIKLPAFAPTELRRLEESVNKLGELLLKEKHRDSEREAAHAAAVSANRTKSEFLANMSHELRTPLNAILGFSEMMQMRVYGPLGSDRYDEYVNDIVASATHLLSLINDILDISKIEFGKLTLTEEEIPLERPIRASLTLMRERARESGVTLVENFASPLPEIVADETKIKQILLNLLSNAVKFTPSGGTVTVSVATAGLNGGTTIEIADTGIGIPEDQIAKALEPFGQIDSSATRRHEGSGLGLPLAKALVELHGGTFGIESKVSVGTRVWFTLPPSRTSEPSDDAVAVMQFAAPAMPKRAYGTRPGRAASGASIVPFRAFGGSKR